MTSTSYLDFAKKFNENLQTPFDFMRSQRKDFVDRRNDLRNLFIENQKVPEALSQTKLQNATNNFNIDNLNQNRDNLLETSRLNTEFGLNDSRFKLGNQELTQNVTKTSDELLLANNRNKILFEEGKNIFDNALTGTINDTSRSSLESVDDLLARTNKNTVAKSLAKKEIRERFSSSIKGFNNKLKIIREGQNAISDIESGIYGTGDDKSVPSTVQRKVTSMIRALNEDHSRIEFLDSRNLLSPEESENYQKFIELKGGSEQQVETPTETPLQPANLIPQTQPAVVQPQPAVAQPESAITQAEPIQEEQVKAGQNVTKIKNIDPELFTVLNTPPSPKTAAQQLEVIRNRLSGEQGIEIFENLGYSEDQVFQIVKGLKQLSEQADDQSPLIDTSQLNNENLEGFKIRHPNMGRVINEKITPENQEEFSLVADKFLENPENRKLLVQTIGRSNVEKLIENLSSPEQEVDISIELSKVFANDPDIQAFIESIPNISENKIIGDQESAIRGANKIVDESDLINTGSEQLIKKLSEVLQIG